MCSTKHLIILVFPLIVTDFPRNFPVFENVVVQKYKSSGLELAIKEEKKRRKEREEK